MGGKLVLVIIIVAREDEGPPQERRFIEGSLVPDWLTETKNGLEMRM